MNVAARLVVTATLLCVACGGDDVDNPPVDLCPALPTLTQRAGQSCGVSFAPPAIEDSQLAYGTDASKTSLDRAATLGIDSLSLMPLALQDTAASSSIDDQLPPGDASLDRLREEAKRAKARGLSVLVKPHVLVRSGEWSGDIKPKDPDAWFAAYRAYCLRYAKLAEQVGAEWYSVGVELKASLASQPDKWVALVKDIRKVYSGKLTYSANWDNADKIKLWHDLDAVGIQMFAPLCSDPNCTPAQMLAGAQDWVFRYRTLANQMASRLLLTEVGYTNRRGAVVEPWQWPGDVPDDPRDDARQVCAYKAIIATFGQSTSVSDIHWWHWVTDLDHSEDRGVGFWPLGKPAEHTLRAACSR